MTKPLSKKKKKIKTPPTKKLTRKELRKQKQQQKKENKRAFFCGKGKFTTATEEATASAPTKTRTKPTKLKQPLEINEKLLSCTVASDDDDSIDSDFSDAEVDALMPAGINKQVKVKSAPPPTKKLKVQTSTLTDARALHRRELERQKDLENAARKNRIKQLKVENEEEERMIARLEKKLKLNKTKDKNRLVRKMFNDGLDYALEFCLDDDEERAKRELKEKRREEQQKAAQWSDDNDDDDGFEGLLGEDDGDTTDAANDAESGEDEPNDDDDNVATNHAEEFKEDIYGRKRDRDGNVISDHAETDTLTQKYRPPQQRALNGAAADSGDAQLSEQLARLARQCKGLLNRLSASNLHKIAASLEQLYTTNARHHMNATLTRLLGEALLGATLCSERMVQEHIVLLAYLHAHVGSEIGAHFLQTYVTQFADQVERIEQLAVEDKRLNNLTLLLAYMYLFKMYEHRLLLQLIDRLGGGLCEKAVECLLLLFQSVGFKLRKDDPLAFKQMMGQLQQRIAVAPLELKANVRLRFMVDILNAVKNNNISKLPQFDPELAEQLRKQLKAMLRPDKYVVTLNISMEDLLCADRVGKWWVVGSAWTGHSDDANATATSTQATVAPVASKFSEKLLRLAKAQQMNTEERRNIFCICMSAADYVDAFEKILHLSLRDQRSIAYVIVHCCLHERRPNPYYSHLALKFCTYNRKFQLAFQFATWDRLNDIEALTRPQIRNLAAFVQSLVLCGGVALSVLKVVNFLQLDKSSFLFMREVMVALLLHADEKAVQQAFERIAKNTKLLQFKNSLRLFMQHFLLQNEGAKLKLTAEQLDVLRRRVEYADNILAYVDL